MENQPNQKLTCWEKLGLAILLWDTSAEDLQKQMQMKCYCNIPAKIYVFIYECWHECEINIYQQQFCYFPKTIHGK